jgi:acetyl-CoA carboxylase biotin carboxyl carrier protein
VDLKQIKELMAAMEKAGIKKMSIKEKTGYELSLEREGDHLAAPTHHVVHSPPHFVPHVSHVPHKEPETHAKPAAHPPAAADASGKFITSPMVGTFYASPSPDDPHFVKVGDRVEEGTVVCIIEAMKVMNEVKAGISGIVAEIYHENGHPVEFGSKLFRIT